MEDLGTNERWVAGMEGRYSVDTEGNVFSYLRKQKLNMAGGVMYDRSRGRYTYRVVALTFKGVQRTFYVHKLVAEAFIPNPENKPQVNHIDGDKLNNPVENLEWVTNSENMQHAYDAGLNKGRPAVSNEEQRKRADDLILKGSSGSLHGNTVMLLLKAEDFHRNHVPPEMIKVKRTKSIGGSYLFLWNHYIDLFRLCDSGMSLSQVANITGFDPSMVSYIRCGKRAIEARLVYDKYKNDPYYFQNYSQTYVF